MLRIKLRQLLVVIIFIFLQCDVVANLKAGLKLWKTAIFTPVKYYDDQGNLKGNYNGYSSSH